MKILITGVYGFLGFHLANKLSLVDGFQIYGLYHTSKKEGLNESVKTYNSIDAITIQPDIVVMCHAAVSSGNINLTKEELILQNVNETEKIASKFNTSKLIYISTASIFQNDDTEINEKSLNNPLNDYSKSKLMAEEIVCGDKNVILRISSLYGDGMKENTLIPNYCNQALENKSIEVWGNGSRKQNYIHVADVVEMLEKIIDKENIEEAVLLGVSTKEYTNLEVAKIVSELTNAKIKCIKEDNSKSIIYNNDITRKSLNWEPKIELEEGIKKYLEWKQKQF